jgi:hypothetical protein
MKRYICFDEWNKTEAFSEPSGRSEKLWLMYPFTAKIGLFKYPKVDQFGNLNTFEHISEDLSSELARVLEVPCCNVDIGTYKDRIGSMSYLINDTKTEILIEGVNCITYSYHSYDPNLLIDPDSQTRYSIEMIEKSLRVLGLWEAFLKIPIFDYYIGNTDRHQSNWAIIFNHKRVQAQLSPLYDNGSSLCALIKDQDIGNIFRDENRLQALIHTKSRSRIGLKNIAHPTHDQMIEFLRAFYYEETKDYVQKYLALTDERLDSIISLYDNVISSQRKKLLYFYLSEKRRHLLEIYN